MQQKFIALEGFLQVQAQPSAQADFRIDDGLKKPGRVGPFLFGPLQCVDGVGHQLGGRRPIFRIKGDANAVGEGDFLALKGKWQHKGFFQALDQMFRIGKAVNIFL